jgi:adenosylcobinamide-phosphate synthase
MSFAGMMVVAMLLDLALGWPAPVYARIGHPVTWIGALIRWLDSRFNLETDTPTARRIAGTATLILVTAAAALPMLLAQALLPDSLAGTLIGGLIAWPLVALRSMHDHVAAVAKPLTAMDLPAARYAVSMIVGRDTTNLDEAATARAALESLAENTSDGVVAPLFWGAVFGLPGIAAYKAVNTLDSMIGHRTPRFTHFGWASARFDDLVNLIPARATGALFALTSARPRDGLRVMLRDARLHRSPNAGWPEAAMAAALNVRLSGPRVYANHTANEPWVNAAAPDPTAADLTRGLALYRRAMLALGAILALIWSLA